MDILKYPILQELLFLERVCAGNDIITTIENCRRITDMPELTNEIREQIKKRRTFAIISHPDAGKTTLTEKFLLYGGAINQAGSVKGKATARHAVSDWMEIEE